MIINPITNYWQLNQKLIEKLESIDIPLKKLLNNRINQKLQNIFNDIETFCLFIGYPRSGHTLIGSLIDAHPNAVISHELDALKFLKEGFTKNQIFKLILKNSSSFTKAGRRWGKYSYLVPNQWNGKFRTLKVIGDKKGGGSAKILFKNPSIIQDLDKTINCKKIKYIHIIRNPYDNITTISKKHFNNDLKKAIDLYFYFCKANYYIKSQNENIMDIKHESFIDDPKNCLKKICGFLDLDAPTDYLDDCSQIVYKNPRKRRFEINWSSENKEIVKKKINEFDYLQGYSFSG